MVKVNGWKRIGIIASIAWILGAGVISLNVFDNARIKSASQLTLDCEKPPSGGSAFCDKLGTDYLAGRNSGQWIGVAFVAFVPIPLGWGFTYLVLFLVRWVKRGFLFE
jgi:hypothetical protein